jgi:hypothetical protein
MCPQRNATAGPAHDQLGDAHDPPDTGRRRSVPCECGDATCMCTCGRCMAEPLPIYRGPR